MIKTLIPFTLTTGIVLIAFALMYYIDMKFHPDCAANNNTGENKSLSFCTVTESLLKVFTMFINGEMDNDDLIATKNSTTISIIFAILVIILLLNVLIAVVVDCYNNSGM